MRKSSRQKDWTKAVDRKTGQKQLTERLDMSRQKNDKKRETLSGCIHKKHIALVTNQSSVLRLREQEANDTVWCNKIIG